MKGSLNLNNLYKVFSLDKKHSLSLGCYGGAVTFDIFSNEKQQNSGPVGKIYVDNNLNIQIKKLLASTINKQEKTSNTLSVLRFDAVLKQPIPTLQIIIGRNEDGIIYLDIALENSKEPIRFLLCGFPTFFLNGEALNDKQRSEIGAEDLAKTLDSCFIGKLLTKESALLEELAKNKKTATNSSFEKSTTETDIEF